MEDIDLVVCTQRLKSFGMKKNMSKKTIDDALVEYRQVSTEASTEYDRLTAEACAVYRRMTAEAHAECDRVTDAAWAKYQEVIQKGKENE